jgi:hypothetical protein
LIGNGPSDPELASPKPPGSNTADPGQGHVPVWREVAKRLVPVVIAGVGIYIVLPSLTPFAYLAFRLHYRTAPALR